MKIPGLHLTRSTIALSIKAFAVLLATTAIFYQDLAILASEALKNELMSYILAVPFLLMCARNPLSSMKNKGQTEN